MPEAVGNASWRAETASQQCTSKEAPRARELRGKVDREVAARESEEKEKGH